MRLRERVHDPMGGAPADDDASGLEAVRNEAERFFAAGDAAIARALGSDSEAFLQAGRQQGGE